MLKKKFLSIDAKNAAALLVLGIPTRVENHAIPRLERNYGIRHFDMIFSNSGNHTEKCSPFFSKAGANQFLVVHAMHPSGIEAP